MPRTSKARNEKIARVKHESLMDWSAAAAARSLIAIKEALSCMNEVDALWRGRL